MDFRQNIFLCHLEQKGLAHIKTILMAEASSDSFISAWIALQDVTSFNGGLILWPGTHKEIQLELVENGIESYISESRSKRKKNVFKVIPKKYKAFSPNVPLGSVIFIHSWPFCARVK